MELKILGSGGAMPTPRAFCQCDVCKNARKGLKYYKRNSSSLYIKEAKAIIDAPEDITNSINRENIKRDEIKNIFITHWHPDHAFGLRSLLESNYDFRQKKAINVINLFIAKNVFEDLTKRYDVLAFLRDVEKVVKINFFEKSDSIKLGNVKITSVSYNGGKSEIYGYLIEENEKKVLYAPCDSISFKNFIPETYELDLLINECGLFSYRTIKSEISFPDLMKRIKELKPKKTVLTHIEEVELQKWGWDYMDKMKKKYSDVDFEFGYDGMIIKI